MADELTSKSPSVDQTLHGYSDGHRLIAGTAKLASGDARSMLILSDASGPGVDQAVDGYLTGYPLQGCGKYVLARTWGAPEMSRPGCVWTHSLLIDFSDLATLSNAEGLLSLFRRPDGGRQGYDRRLRVPSSAGHPVTNPKRAGGLLNALYLHPLKKVEMQVRRLDDERLVLAVWFQQWPRLRRSFRFCTLVGTDRSSSAEVFDLQLMVDRSRTQRISADNIAIVEDGPAEMELSTALNDLLHPASDGLAAFLRQVGGDVSDGRSAMLPLCRLYNALNSLSRDDASFAIALDAFESLSMGQGQAAREIVFEKALELLDTRDDRSLDFVLDNVAAQAIEVREEVVAKIGTAIWCRSPRQFASALEEPGPIGHVVRSAIPQIEPSLLVKGIASDPLIGRRIALQRLDLLLDQTFWAIPGLAASSILEVVDVEGSKLFSMLTALVAAGRTDAADAAISRFGPGIILKVIAALDQSGGIADVGSWTRAAVRHSLDVAKVLTSGGIPRRMVVELSKSMEPDDLPNDFGEDPWAIASASVGQVEPEDEIQFAAFLLARALGYRSRSCAKLLAASFERTHKALASGEMSDSAWRRIERRLSWVFPWMEWDRCGRVREAVVDKFVNLDLDPATFGRLTTDGSLFADMTELASRSGRGRRYLARVRRFELE